MDMSDYKPPPDLDSLTVTELEIRILETEDRIKFAQDHGAESILITMLRGVLCGFRAERARRNGNGNGHHFELIDVKSLLALEEPDTSYLWGDILPKGGMSLNVAKPKVGKTTFALNLAVAVARGEPFLGRPTAKGKVIYLA